MGRIYFYCPIGFEPWDYTSLERGIGGSEQAVIEMSRRLAARGNDVAVFGNLTAGCEPERDGVLWYPLNATDPGAEAIWILHRTPVPLDMGFRGQKWVWMQDVDSPNPADWTADRCRRATCVLALCRTHAAYLSREHPAIAGKIRVTSNGVDAETMREVEAAGVTRNPHRMMWSSSPDRGLVGSLLSLWPRIRELVPDAEMHVYYGWENLDKVIAAGGQESKRFSRMKARFRELIDQPGIYHHGRVGQKELYRAWLSSGVWPYFTNFTETSCISCMEAQAAGCIPVTRPLWALAENVHHGIFVDGDVENDRLVQAELIQAVAQVANQEPEWAREVARDAVMTHARKTFDWERVVDQWESWIGD